MGRKGARITGFALSTVTILLGTTTTVLLYYAGQQAVDAFYSGTTTDPAGRIVRPNPADDWYGQLILKGWTAGIIYILTGITGIASSLFYNTPCMVVHLITLVLVVIIGSFVHCGGGMLLIVYRVLVSWGYTRYQFFLGECTNVDFTFPHTVTEDEQCVAGRKALLLALSALGVMFVTWVFAFSDMLYRSLTFHCIQKKQKVSYTRATARPSSARPRGKQPSRVPVTLSSEPGPGQHGGTKPGPSQHGATQLQSSPARPIIASSQAYDVQYGVPETRDKRTDIGHPSVARFKPTDESGVATYGQPYRATPGHPEILDNREIVVYPDLTSFESAEMSGVRGYDNAGMVDMGRNNVEDYKVTDSAKL